MHKKNHLSDNQNVLESRLMLAASVAQSSISVENGQVVSQSSQLQGNGSVRASVNGQDVINRSSMGAAPAAARGAMSAAGQTGSSIANQFISQARSLGSRAGAGSAASGALDTASNALAKARSLASQAGAGAEAALANANEVISRFAR